MIIITRTKNKINNGMKTVTVTSGKIKTSIDVDSHYDMSNDSAWYNNVLVEACTKIYEVGIKNRTLKVTPIMEVDIEIFGKKTHCILNSYKILINASKYKLAETLRKQFLKEFGIDLKNEPIRSGNHGRS